MTVASEDPVLRELSADDEPALTTFSCRHFRQPWTEVVEEMIRERLAHALRVGDAQAVGLWRDDELLGIAAWRIDPDDPSLCRSILVAVAHGNARRGYGRILKEAVLERARLAGAVVVVSIVHWDNDAMIRLNESLGANVERIPGDQDHCRCIIPLRLN